METGLATGNTFLANIARGLKEDASRRFSLLGEILQVAN